MVTNPYTYFDPLIAGRLANLSLVVRQAVEGFITGLHRSGHRGFSVEFSEHREYTPGDDIRHLDWVAYARSDRYYIKQYEQETNLQATSSWTSRRPWTTPTSRRSPSCNTVVSSPRAWPI